VELGAQATFSVPPVGGSTLLEDKFKRAGRMPFVPQDKPALQGTRQRRKGVGKTAGEGCGHAPICWAKSTMLEETTSKSSGLALSGMPTGPLPYSLGR
jgi:hypothetical protein